MEDNGGPDWYDDYTDKADDTEELQIEEYDITASPNDFNVMTLCSYVDSGSVRIPGFQRNFVWDIKRASRLIESLTGTQQACRDRWTATSDVDLLLRKKKFPRQERRADIRRIFDRKGTIPDEVFHDDEYFQTFNLQLTGSLPNRRNKFKGLNYTTLGDYRSQLDLRPIRNIVVKQNAPSGDDSSMFEVFNRLNSGGINLRPQEIRTSMYHSAFYTMLYRINAESEKWRELVGEEAPDLHMKDIEILLRGFAMLVDGHNYAPSMVKFLNRFSNSCKANGPDKNQYLERLFDSFLDACSGLPPDAFKNKKNNRFNIALYEAVFAGSCKQAFAEQRAVEGRLEVDRVHARDDDEEFSEAARVGTTNTVNVKERLRRAEAILGEL